MSRSSHCHAVLVRADALRHLRPPRTSNPRAWISETRFDPLTTKKPGAPTLATPQCSHEGADHQAPDEGLGPQPAAVHHRIID